MLAGPIAVANPSPRHASPHERRQLVYDAPARLAATANPTTRADTARRLSTGTAMPASAAGRRAAGSRSLTAPHPPRRRPGTSAGSSRPRRTRRGAPLSPVLVGATAAQLQQQPRRVPLHQLAQGSLVTLGDPTQEPGVKELLHQDAVRYGRQIGSRCADLSPSADPGKLPETQAREHGCRAGGRRDKDRDCAVEQQAPLVCSPETW